MILLIQKYTVYFIALLFFTSCANSVIEEAPWNSNAPIPVVYSIISPNEPVQVYVNKTYNQNFPAVKNPYPEAKVFMSGQDNKWIELTRLSPDTCIYEDIQKQLIIEKGKTYSLKVVLNNRTVQAQTTVLNDPAGITAASCVFTGKTDINFNFDSLPKNWHVKYDTIHVNQLSVKFSLPGNSDCKILFSENTKQIYGTMFLNQGSFQTNYFETPKDSTSFTLDLTTLDPNFKKYVDAQSINSVSTGYSSNIPILALIESFGGVLPKFSNIVNGVGLFGSSVTVSQRVVITKPAN